MNNIDNGNDDGDGDKSGSTTLPWRSLSLLHAGGRGDQQSFQSTWPRMLLFIQCAKKMEKIQLLVDGFYPSTGRWIKSIYLHAGGRDGQQSYMIYQSCRYFDFDV